MFLQAPSTIPQPSRQTARAERDKNQPLHSRPNKESVYYTKRFLIEQEPSIARNCIFYAGGGGFCAFRHN
jgi:hypothetical protein